MQDETPGRSRQGAVTVLALLLSLLLGYAPAAATSAQTDRSALRLGKSESGKASAVLRSGARAHADDKAGNDLLGASPARPITASLWRHPAQSLSVGETAGERAPLTRAYRARAPPAA